MSNAMPEEALHNPPAIAGCTPAVDPADLEAHVAKVKAAWRGHERAMTWEQKIAAIESGRQRLLTVAPHTTHRAGPQWAVQQVGTLDEVLPALALA